MNTIEDAARKIRIFIRDYLNDGEVRRHTPGNILTNEQFPDVLEAVLLAFQKAMCSKEGPSDEEIRALPPKVFAWIMDHPREKKHGAFGEAVIDTALYLRDQGHFPRSPKVEDEPVAWMSEHGDVIRDSVRGMVGHSALTYDIPLYRHPAPKVGALLEAAKALIARWDSPKWEWAKHGPTADLIYDLRYEVAKADASLQGEGQGDNTNGK